MFIYFKFKNKIPLRKSILIYIYYIILVYLLFCFISYVVFSLSPAHIKLIKKIE